jgi:hypothetical protein
LSPIFRRFASESGRCRNASLTKGLLRIRAPLPETQTDQIVVSQLAHIELMNEVWR